MTVFVGLDVSQRETEICVVDQSGQRVWRGRCGTDPEYIRKALATHAGSLVRVGMETGPLAIWLWHALRNLGVPIDCIHARHIAAALSLQTNKTDTNDAFGIAQVVRSGWYRPVAVKSLESCRVRALLSARAELVAIRTTLYNQIRGLLKTFGIVLPPGKGGTFAQAVAERCPEDALVRAAVDALLRAWQSASDQKQAIERHLVRLARTSESCRRMATIPGVGAITALTFVTTIDNPGRFSHSRDVGAFLGLTPRRYQSGDVDLSGRISKAGDRMTRALLFEAANALLTRVRNESELRRWGLQLVERIGSKKAKVAVARKLSLIMHRMWMDGTVFKATAA